MNIDRNGVALLAQLEGLVLKPYLCANNVPTIGLGNTYYANGKKVKMTDPPITKEQAYDLFYMIAPDFESAVNELVESRLNQHQFNALFCFCYNIGYPRWKKSTLLRMVNENPDGRDKITAAFLLWKGRKNLLLSRQVAQINEYFK